jgi:hypothetical protein
MVYNDAVSTAPYLQLPSQIREVRRHAARRADFRSCIRATHPRSGQGTVAVSGRTPNQGSVKDVFP